MLRKQDLCKKSTKSCEKRIKCWSPAFSLFPSIFTKLVLHRGIKTCECSIGNFDHCLTEMFTKFDRFVVSLLQVKAQNIRYSILIIFSLSMFMYFMWSPIAQSVGFENRWSLAQPIFFPRIDDSHCNGIHCSLTTVHCFDDDYVGKLLLA